MGGDGDDGGGDDGDGDDGGGRGGMVGVIGSAGGGRRDGALAAVDGEGGCESATACAVRWSMLCVPPEAEATPMPTTEPPTTISVFAIHVRRAG
jgi:hypothetical protein